MAKAAASTAVVSPNYGLFLDRPVLAIPPEGLQAGMNFRILNQRINNFNLGRRKFSTWTLGSAVLGIDNFFPRGVDEHLLFLTAADIYRYDATDDVPVYLTPRYETGTIAVTNGSKTVTGTSTAWGTSTAKAGDMIYVGATGETSTTATWYTIASVDSTTQITLTAAYAGSTATGQAYTLRQLFTVADDSAWNFSTFVDDGDTGDDQWLATNGLDDVVSWDGNATQVTVHSELGFKCTTLATYRNQMIYGCTTDADGTYNPTTIINSEPGYPFHAGSNVTSDDSLSSEFRVHSGTDKIINLTPLGDNLVIYAEQHVVLGQYVGGDTIFMFREVISDRGPVAPRAVADFGNYHKFIGPDTEYTFDGVSADKVNLQVMRNLVLQIDPVRKNQCFKHFDESNGDLIWSVPLTTDDAAGTLGGIAEEAYVEHYLEEIPQGVNIPFSHRSFIYTATGFYERQEGSTWADAAGAWKDTNFAWNDQFNSMAAPLNLGGDSDGQIWIFGQDQLDNGTGLPSNVIFGRRATGSGRERNILRRVYPFATEVSGNTLTVNVYFADHMAKTGILLSTESFDEALVEGGHFVSVFHRGRFYDVEFASPSGTGWEISGYDVDITAGGLR